MSEQDHTPLENTPAVADAIADDVAVNAFITGRRPGADNPKFQQPGEAAQRHGDESTDPERFSPLSS
ncbi:hypothetical protein [Actinoplanes sp. NPDC051859]|uniref:hypothetical protein n=1 Tax=Actinoplanes sp. NPDC051859 TaxID=3363909 RepID=UPI003792D033